MGQTPLEFNSGGMQAHDVRREKLEKTRSVILLYMDDSYDQQADFLVFSVLAVKDDCWLTEFDGIKDFRSQLRKQHGIGVSEEIHAWKLVSGRGRPSAKILTKYQRSVIFKDILTMMVNLSGLQIFNACGPFTQHARLFERLMNRINRTLETWKERAVLISDEGKEEFFNRLRRRMAVYNPIPSKYGRWQGTDEATKNIPIHRILEDIFFKDSAHSHFIQLADCVAYALLRREKPVPSKSKYGIDQAFDILKPITIKVTNPSDPDGIIRLK